MGSLAPAESRPLADAGPRQLFIAEARPHTGRKFTPTLNVRTADGNVCHGFLEPENDGSLKEQGTLRDYLRLEPNLVRRFREWAVLNAGEAAAVT